MNVHRPWHNQATYSNFLALTLVPFFFSCQLADHLSKAEYSIDYRKKQSFERERERLTRKDKWGEFCSVSAGLSLRLHLTKETWLAHPRFAFPFRFSRWCSRWKVSSWRQSQWLRWLETPKPSIQAWLEAMWRKREKRATLDAASQAWLRKPNRLFSQSRGGSKCGTTWTRILTKMSRRWLKRLVRRFHSSCSAHRYVVSVLCLQWTLRSHYFITAFFPM